MRIFCRKHQLREIIEAAGSVCIDKYSLTIGDALRYGNACLLRDAPFETIGIDHSLTS